MDRSYDTNSDSVIDTEEQQVYKNDLFQFRCGCAFATTYGAHRITSSYM